MLRFYYCTRALGLWAGSAAARSGVLIRLAYVLAADQHAAEDLLQTALTRAAAHWGRIHTAPEAYVRQIMYRVQVSCWRARWRPVPGLGHEDVDVFRSAELTGNPGSPL